MEIIYRANAYRAGPLSTREAREYVDRPGYPINPFDTLHHASWLCMQVPALVGVGDEVKARRYLAMAEAIMFVHGFCAWADIESINNNPENVG